jgi:epoxyqueuosine reductase
MMFKALIKKHAEEAGFDLVGVSSVDAQEGLRFSREWVERGFGGEMRYLENPKRDDPRRVLPSAKSVICVGLIYNAPLPYSVEVDKTGRKGLVAGSREGKAKRGQQAEENEPRTHDHGSKGWISRYAWGTDYHKIMRSRLEKLRRAIEAMAAGVETRVFVDTGPVVERVFSRLAGIGWAGKNTCLINESKGSWFFLGVILTSLVIEPDMPAPDRCGTCTACIEACPTNALVKPYVMDASRCIAYLNIELKGTIPEQFRPAMGANVVGCDICQDVCPWNNRLWPVGLCQSEDDQPSSNSSLQPKRAATTDLAEFQPMQVDIGSIAGEGTASNSPLASELGHRTTDKSHLSFSLFNPSIESLASLTEEDFRRVFQKSPIKRVKYQGWRRNLCVAMGNSGESKFIPHLKQLHTHADPITREHAGWAIERILNFKSSAAGTRPPQVPDLK